MITPLDIENKKFNKQMMSGYNVEEVDDFLDEIMHDYEIKYKEVTELNAKIEDLNNNLSRYKNIEDTLQNTLLMAQSTAEEVKKVAQQQADQMISEAKRQSEEVFSTSKQNLDRTINELNQEIRAKEKNLDETKKQFDIYKAKMESLLISQLELIKEINKSDE